MIVTFICTYKLIYIVEIICSYDSGELEDVQQHQHSRRHLCGQS